MVFVFGGTETDIVARDDGCFELIVYDVIFNETVEHVEISAFFRIGRGVTQEQKFALSHLIFLGLLIYSVPFAYLLELFLNFIDFGDIDECHIFF